MRLEVKNEIQQEYIKGIGVITENKKIKNQQI